jgi:cAMP-dependent protein kinase regulator
VGKVSTASRGTAFGELALLHDAPRAATIVATSPLSGYSIDALTFKCLLMGKSQQDTREGVEFLSAIKLLSPLDEAQKRELAATATERRFDDGANIICEGARAPGPEREQQSTECSLPPSAAICFARQQTIQP